MSPTLPRPGLHDCMVHLSHVHRFEGGGAIGQLATAVKAGRADEALEVLHARGPDVELAVEPGAPLEAVFGALVQDRRFARLGSAPVEDKLKILSSFRFLCAHRRQQLGVHALNAFVAQHLTRHGLLQGQGDWYDGRPILITSNDYALELFNGDVGVIAPDLAASAASVDGRPLVAFFPAPAPLRPGGSPPGSFRRTTRCSR